MGNDTATLVTVLLVEDNDGDADYIERALRHAETRFEVHRVAWLNSAMMAIGNRPFNCILLDLSLPDCQGVDTVVRVMESAAHIPIIVMTGHDDMQTGIHAVRFGAQDYLIKGEVHDRVLERAIVYAIERKRTDLIGKRLMRESISQVAGPGSPTETMVKNHLGKLADFVYDLRSYLLRNAPAHVESVDAMAAKYDIDVALREAKSIVRLPNRTPRPQRISDMAMQTAQSIALSAPAVEPSTAKDTLLDVIEESARMSAQYGSQRRDE